MDEEASSWKYLEGKSFEEVEGNPTRADALENQEEVEGNPTRADAMENQEGPQLYFGCDKGDKYLYVKIGKGMTASDEGHIELVGTRYKYNVIAMHPQAGT